MANRKCSRNASFAFFFINFVMFIIAFSTPYWYWLDISGNVVTQGLWMICTELWQDCELIDDNSSQDLRITQAMMCIALIFYVVSMVLYCVWMSKSLDYMRRRHGSGPIGISALSLTLVGSIFNNIGVGVFGYNIYDSLDDVEDFLDGWYYHASFFMAAVAGVVHFINSVLTLCAMLCCYVSRDTGTSDMVLVTTDTTQTVSVPTQFVSPDKAGPVQQGHYLDDSVRPSAPMYPNLYDTAPPGMSNPTQTSHPAQAGHLPPFGYPPQNINLEEPPPPYAEVTQRM